VSQLKGAVFAVAVLLKYWPRLHTLITNNPVVSSAEVSVLLDGQNLKIREFLLFAVFSDVFQPEFV